MNKSGLRQEFELIAFNQNGKWGVRDSESNLVVSANFKEVNAYLFTNGSLVNVFNSDKNRFRFPRKKENPEVESDHSFYKSDNINNKVLLVVSNDFQSFFLQLNYNTATQLAQTTDVLKKYRSKDYWTSGSRNYRQEDDVPVTKEVDTVVYNDCYGRIEYIGNNLFKIEKYTPYYSLEPIDEDGNDAWVLRFNNPTWRLLTPSGELLRLHADKIGAYLNEYCTIELNGRNNLINKEGKTVLPQWFNYLSFPAFDNVDFLAGNYLLVTQTFENIAGGRFVAKTLNLSPKDDDFDFDSTEWFSLLRKFNKINLSAKELSLLFNQATISDEFSVEVLPIMDLYSKEGIKKKLGIMELSQINENLFVCTLETNFYYFFDTTLNKFKLKRHLDITEIPTIDVLEFRFAQKRLADKNGSFLNNNYYHEIFSFNDMGTALVSKSFFESGTQHVDTSISEYVNDENFEYWEDLGSYRVPKIIKYGMIDKSGKEILECKFELDELSSY